MTGAKIGYLLMAGYYDAKGSQDESLFRSVSVDKCLTDIMFDLTLSVISGKTLNCLDRYQPEGLQRKS